MSTPIRPTRLIEPYGGHLIDLVVSGAELAEHKAYAGTLPSIQMSERSVCDFEMLVTGAFSPLDRFMGYADYRGVLEHMRLAGGHLFPIPVTLPVDAEAGVDVGSEIALRNGKNELLGSMVVEEIYAWDPSEEAGVVLGTTDSRHPLVAEMRHWGKHYISGPIRALQVPGHHDFQDLRLTPAQARTALEQRGRENVVAFQTCAPLHRAQEELTRWAIEQVDGVLLLHSLAGLANQEKVDHFTRVRTHLSLANTYFERERIVLGLLPLATRMAGPREVLWHAVIDRNYGANYVIVDRAGSSIDLSGRPWEPYEVEKLVSRYAGELGVAPLIAEEFVYLPEAGRYEVSSKIASGTPTASLSETQVRDDYLNRGELLPEWFTRPETAAILGETFPPLHCQGVCIWFTGLSGSGKSTTAEALLTLLLERGRRVTELDGDVVRTHLSKGLGFSKVDRDTNIRRIGYVASEIVRHGGMVICAAVSPYRATRNDVRAMVGSDNFVEVFVDTPLEVCEQRDIKGMYAKARRGEIKDFTGIDDPYEVPEHPEIVIQTTGRSPEQNARRIIEYLVERGFVANAVEA